MEREENLKKKYSIFYYITFQCNIHCNFCIESGNIKSKIPSLGLDEVKKNYFFLKKKFNLDGILLTGGEPTLHHQFFEILDFFKKENMGIRLCTNLLRFGQKDFFEKIKPHFLKFKTGKQKKFTLINASIHNLPEASRIDELRIKGLIQSLKARLPLSIITLISKDNLENLPKLTLFLKRLFYKYAPDKKFYYELRLPCPILTPQNIIKKSMPQNFLQLKKTIEAVASLFGEPSSSLRLLCFPFCYVNNFKQIDRKRVILKMNTPFLVVDKYHQLNKVEIWDYYKNCEKLLKSYKACQKCSFRESCSGIHKDYIEKYNFPLPEPIKI